MEWIILQLRAAQKSRTLAALLCSALLCSALSILRRIQRCQPLILKEFQLLSCPKMREGAKSRSKTRWWKTALKLVEYGIRKVLEQPP